ncbi:hypothetical protein JF50_12625 [Pseudoalteromonas luteoviolacea]|uniref:Lipoprotein n=1 Tax=Pseudoalteromonas luteoviolacea TaxID=43657 RepID=A0A023PYQ0_9GAMM|nr:hypothetical protein [Pseudoalteromonas luteoviolacea]AHX39714.1 hypothetical protein [Pseudoalteromonas luteoviolacea]KID56748.1 hypothetical protein JF50_12625 [Pseudoalteromonas luteoviolacea]
MKVNQLTVAPILASIFALAGCGGSSSDPQDNNPVVTKPDAQPTLTLNVKKRTECGLVAYPNASIVFHDDNGQVVASHSSDSSGYFSQQIPAGAKHASIIGMENNGGFENFRKIYTKLDISSGADFTTIEFQDLSAYCKCKEIDVDLSALKVTHSRFRVSRSNGGDIQDYQDVVKVCGNDEKVYYTIDQPGYGSSLLAVIDLPEGVNTITVNGSDFVHHSADLSTSQFEQKSKVYLSAVDKIGNHFFQDFDFSVEGGVNLKMYPTGFAEHELSNYQSILFHYEGLPVAISNGVTLRFDKVDQIGELTFPIASTELAQQLTVAISSLEQGDAVSYDFTGLDTRIQSAAWEFSFDTSKYPIKWHVSGALVSELPSFSFGDETFLPAQNRPDHSRVMLSGFDGAPASLSEYRRYVYQRPDKKALGHRVFISVSTFNHSQL